MKRQFKHAVSSTLIILLVLSCKNSTNSEIKSDITSQYNDYIEEVKSNVKKLSTERKAKRDKWLLELKSNSVYVDLVDSSSVSVNYLPVLNAISDAIKNSYSLDGISQFGISEDLITYIENSENGEQKMKFTIIAASLSMQMNGGVPKEIINVFDRYKKKYNLYAESGTNIYTPDGNNVKIDKGYNLSYAFALFDSQDKKALDAIYESVNKGISQWNENDDQIYENGFMALKSDYMKHLKEVYPESPYLINADFEITSSELYSAYDANEVSADEKYKGRKIAITGTIDNIGKDVMNNPYISFREDYLKSVTCYFSKEDKKIISQLNKGEVVTIIGECRGMALTNVLIKNCTIN